MPQIPKPLSVLQIKVLKWVNDGCPGGIFEGYSHRISARALADDRYITITGKGPTWTAKITQRGVELLTSIAGSDANNHTHQSEADNFIQKLTAAGGVLEVEGGYSHRAANDALIRDVMKSALRPKGYKLEITSVGSWQSPKYEARWARHFPDDVDERPVPIPDSVGKYHPVAKAFRDGTKGVSKEHVARAAKLLHALATASTVRGYEVTLPSSHKRTNSRETTTLDGDIAITIGEMTATTDIAEIFCDESGHDGENLMAGTTPVLAHSSLHMDLAEATDLVAYLRTKLKAQSPELKASDVLRNGQAIDELFGANGKLVGHVQVYLVEKANFAVGKIIDLLIEEEAYRRGINLYAGGTAKQMADDLYEYGPRALGAEGWNDLVSGFTSLMRTKQRKGGEKETVDSFFEKVDTYRLKSRRDKVSRVLELVWRTRHHADAFQVAIAEGLGPEDSRSTADDSLSTRTHMASQAEAASNHHAR